MEEEIKKFNEGENIISVDIEQQMKTAYIDYSMSVIVARALPDVRDGLKPVHRRILYAMWDMNNLSNQPHKKSARIVGEVLGKYHPHGDTAVYDAMVRMAQPWSMRYPLIDGHGNFGSPDGDSPAAMRYTEARMRKIAEEMLTDIEKDTIDWRKNFDNTLEEPTVLPAKIPALLVNGSSGIAVGMATNMAPHNLGEVVDGTIAYIDNPEISIPELMEYIKAPDFTSKCVIYGYEGVRDAYTTGRGRVVMRGVTKTETTKTGAEKIVVVALPYQVAPGDFIRNVVDLIKDGRIEGIANINDESNKKEGTRVVIDVKKDAVTKVIVNKLYQMTQLQSSFSINNVAIVDGKPQTLNLKDLIANYVKHRLEVVTRRCQFELRKAEERVHIVEGLLKALDIIDEIIAVIRASKNVTEARETLMKRWDFSDIQAGAIVDMRLRQLTGLERAKLQEEYDNLLKLIAELKALLADERLRLEVIKKELLEIKEKYGDKRNSEIQYETRNFRIEDTIPDKDMVITVSHLGYIKRTALEEYRAQARGGQGSRGSNSRDGDYIEYIYIASNHKYLLFFTEAGRCYWMRVFELPEESKQSRGRSIKNLLDIGDDNIRSVLNVEDLSDKEYLQNKYVVFCTEKGVVKKTRLEAFSRPRQKGIYAISIREGDRLLSAKLTTDDSDILLATHSGRAIRFKENNVRSMGRVSSGVRGIRLSDENDYIVGMACVGAEDKHDLLVISENGFGKRSPLEYYTTIRRGGKGIKTMRVTQRTGLLLSFMDVTNDDDLLIITKRGILIRMHISDIKVAGRSTQGVRLITLKNKDEIASAVRVARSEEDDGIEVAEVSQVEEVMSKDDVEIPDAVDNISDEEIEKENAEEELEQEQEEQ